MNYSYLSKTSGIGGTFKERAEDFIVEEIQADGTILEINKKISLDTSSAEFVHFILQKKNWTTADALNAIADNLHINFRRFNYAGTKDKIALSTQLVSCFNGSIEKIQQLHIRDIEINGAWYSSKKIDLGDLLGNRFTVKVEGACNNAKTMIEKINSELFNQFPNYFGEQRFGTNRRNTHIIGEKLIRNRIKDAVMTFLCNSEGENNEEAKLARKELLANQDFEQALSYFPKHLRLERTLIAHVARFENDYAGALRKLPRTILLLFVHAFQSHLFNQILSDRIKDGILEKEDGEYFCGENFYGFPDSMKKQESGWLVGKLIGYESELNEREKSVLEQYNIRKEDFKIKSLPEVSSKGTYRTFFAPFKDFQFLENTFCFSLPSGSYATVALREFLDKK